MVADHQKKILVTGGAGYIGSHCCKALAEAGYLPVVFDNLSTGHRDLVKWGPLLEGDIRDESALFNAFEVYRPSAVMHFAALALVGESVVHPEKYWNVNVGGTLALLSEMVRSGVDRLVFSSTCAVYGEPATMPIYEKMPKEPVNPYGASKLAAERMMDDFGHAHDLRSIRLRYFNAAGADPDGEIGEDHSPETHLIPLIFDAVLERRKSISIFGADYPTPDGTAVRDYIHVVDLATAHVKALDYLFNAGPTTAINLGTGRGASVSEVIAAAEQVVQQKIHKTWSARRAGDPPELVANPSKAAELLSWHALHSDLKEIVLDAWAWHRRRFGGQDAANEALKFSRANILMALW